VRERVKAKGSLFLHFEATSTGGKFTWGEFRMPVPITLQGKSVGVQFQP
jgi:hypothetical protein